MHGARILENFLVRIAGLRGTWTMDEFIATQVRALRERIGDRHVVCGRLGRRRLDRGRGPAAPRDRRPSCTASSSTTACCARASATRSRRASATCCAFRSRRSTSPRPFLTALAGIEDPEKKRVTIGHVFVAGFERAATRIDGAHYLAQGTLYPDVIESVSVHGAVGDDQDAPQRRRPARAHELEVVEPLRELFKDEVREIGERLGVPATLWRRHPFPGPGLAVRVLGEVTPERLAMLRAADAIVQRRGPRAPGWYDKLWQAFAVYLPVRSVGVMGDERTYDHASRCAASLAATR